MNNQVESIDWRDKGVWPVGSSQTTAEYVAQGHTLFDGSISWPTMILREDALRTNIDALAKFCRDYGLDFAPHGKTSMAPRLYQMQIDAGAWGITLATAHQVRVARGYGVQRILLANELLDAIALETIASDLESDEEFEFACYVDSPEGVRTIARIGVEHPGIAGGFPVLIDVGYAGGRTGVRAAQEARELAELIAATEGIRLLGVSSYEGGLPTPDAVRHYFADVRSIVDDLREAGLVPLHPIVSAGGSAYFDLVGSELTGAWATENNLQVILRSGAYVTHDDGAYQGKTAYNRIPDQGHLDAAIEVWAQVISVPENSLAIVGMGKRDAPYDEGMPLPLRVRRAETGVIEEVRGRASVPKMDDQHGYLVLSEDFTVRPGDLVCFGISHPCTAFDKWRVLPVLDSHDRVTDLVRTYF